jgi:hypothetical protein
MNNAAERLRRYAKLLVRMWAMDGINTGNIIAPNIAIQFASEPSNSTTGSGGVA